MKIKALSTIALSFLTLGLFAPRNASAALVDFEDLKVPATGYYNGSDGAGGFTSRGTTFLNSYTAAFDSWDGWSYSQKTDTATAGYGNQYSAFAGGGSTSTGGVQAGGTFGVGYAGAVFNLAAGQSPVSIRLTNTTYAAISMRDGDAFAKKFSGTSPTNGDYFYVTMTGYSGANATGGATGAPVNFYLADYRFSNPAQDYIVKDWSLVDLTPLGPDTRSIQLSFTSSDVGAFGINTPTYVAADNLTTVPEPTVAAGAAALLMVIGLRRRRA